MPQLSVLGTIFASNGIGVLARNEQLILLERIGLLYIMLLAGIRMDLSNFKHVGIRASVFGLLASQMIASPVALNVSQKSLWLRAGAIMKHKLLQLFLTKQQRPREVFKSFAN